MVSERGSFIRYMIVERGVEGGLKIEEGRVVEMRLMRKRTIDREWREWWKEV